MKPKRPCESVPGHALAVTVVLLKRCRLAGHYVNPAQTIILKCDGKPRHTHQDPASESPSPILCSMVSHRRGASLVACCTDPCGCPVDRPTDHRGAHATPLAGLDSP